MPTNILFYARHGIAFIVILFVLAIILLGFFPLRHRLLTNHANAVLKSQSSDSCLIQSVEVVPWKSITLEGIYFRDTSDSITSFEVRIAKAQLHINVLQYLAKRTTILSHLSAIRQLSHDTTSYRYRVLTRKALSLCRVLPKGIRGSFSNVWLNVKYNDKTAFLGTDGTLKMSPANNKGEGLLVKGFYPIVNTFGSGIQNVKFNAMLTPEGIFKVKQLTGVYCDGTVQFKNTLALMDTLLPVSYTLSLDKMDLGYWYTMHVKTGKITGAATIVSGAENIPFSSLTHRLSATATINDCHIEDHPLQQSLATSIFIPSLTSLKFTTVGITLTKNSIDTFNITLKATGEQVAITSNGWVLKNGSIRQKVAGSFPPAAIASFPAAVRMALKTRKNKPWNFNCRLYGTIDDPRFELDKETLQRAVGGLFNNLQQDIYDLLMK